jgi:hypothetical protein
MYVTCPICKSVALIKPNRKPKHKPGIQCDVCFVNRWLENILRNLRRILKHAHTAHQEASPTAAQTDSVIVTMMNCVHDFIVSRMSRCSKHLNECRDAECGQDSDYIGMLTYYTSTDAGQQAAYEKYRALLAAEYQKYA